MYVGMFYDHDEALAGNAPLEDFPLIGLGLEIGDVVSAGTFSSFLLITPNILNTLLILVLSTGIEGVIAPSISNPKKSFDCRIIIWKVNPDASNLLTYLLAFY